MFNANKLTQVKNDLINTKTGLQVKPDVYKVEDLQRIRSSLNYLKDDMEKDLNDIQRKKYLLYTITGLSIISTIIAWLLEQPWYTQILVSIVAIVIAATLIYYIYISKDRKQAILDIINLIKEIIEIINDINPTPELPKAEFTANPTNGKAPLTVQFQNTSSGNPVKFQWVFGDNTTSNDQNPTHVYTNAGTYIVTLTVSNAAGSDSKSAVITVTSEPVPKTPPGVEFITIGNVEIARIGGEHQVDIPKWKNGDETWPGGTVKVMDGQDPNFDVMPNYLWAFWYDGALAPVGWMISQQGYYYLDNPITAKNCIQSIVPEPWIQPGVPQGIPLKEVQKIERVGNTWVFTVLHDGKTKCVIWDNH